MEPEVVSDLEELRHVGSCLQEGRAPLLLCLLQAGKETHRERTQREDTG